jgi:hypothetical protein
VVLAPADDLDNAVEPRNVQRDGDGRRVQRDRLPVVGPAPDDGSATIATGGHNPHGTVTRKVNNHDNQNC